MESSNLSHNEFESPLESPSTSASISRGDAPLRLSILHLFFLMSAVAFTLTRYEWGLELSDDEKLKWHEIGVYALRPFYALVQGIALGAVGIWIEQRFRTARAFPSAPGHWLLLQLGIGVFCELVIWPIWHGLGFHALTWILAAGAAAYVARAICLALAVYCTSPGAWRKLLVFGSVAIGMVTSLETLSVVLCAFQEETLNFSYQVSLVTICAQYVEDIALSIAAIWGTALAIMDGRRCKRDVLHYVGVAVLLANSAVWIAWKIWVHFTFPYT